MRYVYYTCRIYDTHYDNYNAHCGFEMHLTSDYIAYCDFVQDPQDLLATCCGSPAYAAPGELCGKVVSR